MSKSLSFLAATATLALTSILPIQSASANDTGTGPFCGGTVRVESFSHLNDPGTGANTAGRKITYRVNLRNAGTAPRNIRVEFFASNPNLIRNPALTLRVNAGAEQLFLLGTHELNNFSHGRLSDTDTQTGLPHFTRVTCPR